jgi:transposase
MIDTISTEVSVADREIRTLFRDDPRLARLSTLPRVGAVTAAVVIAEVWDVGRFPSADRLCSWAGLTPSERSSDVHTRRGHISKQGSRWLRWVMVEVAARPDVDPHYRAFYDRIAARRGRKIARVALARRVLTLCYYALRDKGGCRAFPVAE